MHLTIIRGISNPSLCGRFKKTARCLWWGFASKSISPKKNTEIITFGVGSVF